MTNDAVFWRWFIDAGQKLNIPFRCFYFQCWLCWNNYKQFISVIDSLFTLNFNFEKDSQRTDAKQIFLVNVAYKILNKIFRGLSN